MGVCGGRYISQCHSSFSYYFFKQLAVLLQPGLRFVHQWSLCADDIPEPGRMVSFDKMGKLVDNDIVDDKHRRLDQPPVEADVVLDGARPPAITAVHDLDPGNIDTEFAGVNLYPRDDLFFGPADIPFPQSLFPLFLQDRWNQEAPGKPNLDQPLLDHLDAVLPPQVERRFAADQFLTRWMGQVPVFLRVPCFFINPLTLGLDDLPDLYVGYPFRRMHHNAAIPFNGDGQLAPLGRSLNRVFQYHLNHSA